MKAGIYLGKEKVKIQELPLPEVGNYDVLIQVYVEQMWLFLCMVQIQDIK